MTATAPTDADVEVSGHELTTTRDCPSPGCDAELSPGEELCEHCREKAAPAPYDRRSPVLRDPLGLELAADVDVEEWTGLLRRIAAVDNARRWWISDLLVAGDFGERAKYELAEEWLGLERSTLIDYAYVARNVPRERRRPELSFEHHRSVAPLEPQQQTAWLARAVDEQWSGRALRAELGAVGLRPPVGGGHVPAPRPPSPQPAVLEQTRLTMTWPAGLADRVRATARARQMSMASLVAEAVEQYLAAG
jgi:hypothetical protein